VAEKAGELEEMPVRRAEAGEPLERAESRGWCTM
jgi:hypothetical protein